MAASGQAPTATEYIVHHLTHFTSTGEKQKFIVDFTVFNVDTIVFSLLIMSFALLLMWLAARKVTSGVPGKFQAAIETLVRYLAYELAPRKINVNAVSGGFIDTDSLKVFPSYDEIIRESTRRTPFGRVGTPEEVANVAAFPCTDRASWMTGQVVIVDGGYTLG